MYGSCEEAYLNAACDKFEELYGITVNRQRLSTGEVAAKIEEENGNPTADVWFGGTTDPYNETAAKGLLEPYEAKNATHLLDDMYRDADGYWYGIYKGILGFMATPRSSSAWVWKRPGLGRPAQARIQGPDLDVEPQHRRHRQAGHQHHGADEGP